MSPAMTPGPRRLGSCLAAVLIVTGACGVGQSGPAASGPAEGVLAVAHVNVIDVVSGEILQDRTVLIRDGRITALEPSSTLEVPPGAAVVDGSGDYLIPGLADMHVHFGRGGGLPNSPESVERTLRQYLYYGVTSVLNLGAYSGSADQVLDLRARRAAGELLAPNLYATGGLITVPGSHPVDHWPVPEGADRETHDWSQRGAWVVRNTAEVRDVVARMAAAGMDGVKLIVESTHAPGESIPQMPPELVTAAVEAARSHGLPVFAHAIGNHELQVAVDADVHAVVHLAHCCWPQEELGPQYGPDPDLLRTMRDRGIYYVPTLSARLWTNDLWGDPSEYLTDPFLSGVERGLIDTLLVSPPEPARDIDWAWRRNVLDALKAAHDAGVELVAGSDPPGRYTFHGYALHNELEWMIEAGLSPAEALFAATLGAAEMVGAAEDFGTIEPGRRADLLILSANPLDDIRNTRAIEQVILDGRLLDREHLLH